MAGNNNGRLTNAIGESLSPAAIKLTVPWRSLKYEAVYLCELADGFEARRVIGEWIDFYNPVSQHPSVYAVEVNRFC